MNIVQFSRITAEEFNGYFANVDRALSTGQFSSTVPDPVPSIPQMMVLTETPTHFAVEMIGSRRRHKPLKPVRRRVDSIDDVIAQFTYPPDKVAMFNVDSERVSLQRLALTTPTAAAEAEARFPGLLGSFGSQLHADGENLEPVLRIGPGANFVTLSDCLLVSEQGGAVRAKHVQYLLVVRKDTDSTTFILYLRETLSLASGADLVAATMLSRGSAEVLNRAGQFANVFLMQRLHETAIGSFLDEHRDILLTALDASDFITEPYLPWQVDSPDPDEKAINPDLFVQRADGYWDVYDLKLALLDRRDLTKGRRNRRQFIASVDEGIAQLAHYKETILMPEHRAYMREKYGVVFKDPKFILVVGNMENSHAEKIREAKRKYANFGLIDYDTLLQLYLSRSATVQTPDAGSALA